jgi:amino acid adenylation domain-containing protein
MSSESANQKPELSAAKKALLQARLRQSASQAAEAIPRRNQKEAPLSFAQRRLWFLDQFSPGSCAYNVPRVFRLSGHLEVAALQQALDSLVERHEILRTVFKMAQVEPVQVVQEPSAVVLEITDLTGLEGEDQRTRVGNVVMDEVKRPFNLSSDLMLRAKLLRLAANEHVLVVMSHHITSDGWSKGVMFRELAAFYNAAVSKTPAVLSALPIQYSDFAAWQEQWVKGVRLQKQAAYWKKQLEGAPALLELPTDFPRPAVQGFEGVTESCFFPGKLLADLKALSQREGATLFMTLFASFQVMLTRYSGQEDIVVGTPIAGRVRAEIEPLIGDFVNMLAVRTDLSLNPGFRELLQQVKKVALDAYDNQDLPFEMLVEELERGRDMSRAPVFQTIFILETAPPPPPPMKGLTLEILDFDTPTAKNDLILILAEDAAGLKVKLEYRTDLFSKTTIDRFLVQYQMLLQSIVADPAQPITKLAIRAPEEQKQLAAWNQTAHETLDRCLHQLFEDQVARTPDAIALEFRDRKLSYRELNAGANQLAHHLISLGVKPDSRVGICVHRSQEMLIGLLGIMKAGGAYVPIDPAYPRDRMEFMLQDGGAEVLVIESSLLKMISTQDAKVVCFDRDAAELAKQSTDNPLTNVTSANLSYVIFTSGSTGRPKGVQLEHRNVANFIGYVQRTLQVGPNDAYLGVASMSFDASVLDFYLPLSTGAKFVIVDADTIRDPQALAEITSRSGVTVMHATPSTWRSLVDAGWKGNSTFKLLSGGEALSWDLAKELLPRCGALWNLYGPTETAVYSAIHRVNASDGTVLVGRPIDNTQIYILDSLQQHTPIGVPGEICIAGAGVARGYLSRPELTAERFVADRFVGGNARMYRTGDLGRFRLDGIIQCLGRLDHQVKLRGFRIELGEIESVLLQFPGVRQAVVDVKAGNLGDKRLIGYLVLDSGAGPSLADLRAFLKTKLPEYMVPATFMVLEKLPVSPNGKLNRSALPVPDDERPELSPEFVPPSTPVEQAVAEIFSEVLEVRPVGLNDDFFELGGHSLLAARVVTRLRDRFQIEMTPRFLFESPNAKEMAARISELLVQDTNEDEMAAMLAELAELEER